MKNVKRVLALALALILSLGVLSACGSQKETTPAGSQGGETQAETQAPVAKNYKKKIVIGVANPMTDQDPQGLYDNMHATMVNLSHNQLVSYNFEKRQIEPELAVEWKAEDASTYWFKLRQGVKFSNGEEMKAEDVQFSFTGRPELKETSTQAATFKRIASVEIINDYEVRFHLSSPDADFLTRMYFQTFAIVSKKAFEADPAEGYKVGTGGWQMTDFVPSDHVTYKRVDTSWVWTREGFSTEMNPTEEIELRYQPEASTRTAALEAGQIAANASIDMAEYEVVADNKNLEVTLLPAEVLDYMIINMKNGIAADDDNLRLAIAYALDIDEINQFAQEGKAIKTLTLWGASQYGYFDDFANKLAFNLDTAKDYMSKSKHPNGCDFKIYVTNNYEPIAGLVQAQLKKIGVNVQVKTTDKAGMTEVVKNGEHDAIIMSITLQAIGDRFHFVCNPSSATNRALYENPDMLAKFDNALVEVDDAKRKEIYKDIQIEINEVKPYIPFYYEVLVVGKNKNVSGEQFLPDNKPDYTYIRWAED